MQNPFLEREIRFLPDFGIARVHVIEGIKVMVFHVPTESCKKTSVVEPRNSNARNFDVDVF